MRSAPAKSILQAGHNDFTGLNESPFNPTMGRPSSISDSSSVDMQNATSRNSQSYTDNKESGSGHHALAKSSIGKNQELIRNQSAISSRSHKRPRIQQSFMPSSENLMPLHQLFNGPLTANDNVQDPSAVSSASAVSSGSNTVDELDCVCL